MNQRQRRIVVFVLSVLVAVGTVLIISLSIGSLRDSVSFSRVMRFMEREGVDAETLLEAARFARNRGEWRRLLQEAWRLDDASRWPTVRDIGLLAQDRFPRDDRWRFAAALAFIRLNDHESARDLLPIRGGDTAASILRQELQLLAALDPEEREASTARLGDMAEAPDEATLLRAVGIAEREPIADHLLAAGEATGVTAYTLNGALRAAAAGDRPSAVAAAETIKTAIGDVGRTAVLYLSLWLTDVDWFFREVRALDGREAARPEVLLLQGDAHLQQGQRTEARRFFREVQAVAPAYDPRAFLNDAAASYHLGDGDPRRILRTGLDVFPLSPLLRGELAGVLVLNGQRLEAARVIAAGRTGVASANVPRDPAVRHRDWLLLRAVLGQRTPPERLEADLWRYLNDHPDAEDVAHFLARFLAFRNDEAGLRRLAERYDPAQGEWATTLHMILADLDGDTLRAEELATRLPLNTWTGHYNRALFALRRLPTAEVRPVVTGYRTWVETSTTLDSYARSTARMHLLLTEAESLRLEGRREEALSRVDRALRLVPDDTSVEAYRALLAPPL